MYQDYDYHDMAREVQQNLAKIYAESFQEQEYVDEQKQEDTYKKIQTILNCPEMEKCHQFLYALDMENVNEADTEKINKIYNLGVDRGIIRENDKEETENVDGIITKECDDEDVDSSCQDGLCGGPSDSLTDQEMGTNQLTPTPMDNPDIKKPIYTVLYSGLKEGDLKMGEYYSMAGSTEGAKEDCTAQLTQQGYTNITVMAVEQTTPSYGGDVAVADVSGETPDDANVGVQDVYNEDDSEEFEKQETGDKEDDSIDTDTQKDSGESADVQNVENTDNTENTEDTETSQEDTSSEDNTDNTENTEDNKTEDNEEDKSEEDTENTENADDNKEENSEDNTKEEDDTKNDDEDGEEKKEKLTSDQKNILKDEYTTIFKDVLKKTALEKSVADMTLKERTDFYEKLAEKWTKNDPSEFLNDKEQEKLNKTVVKVK